MEYYWELVERDDSRHEIPPTAVEQVNNWMKNHDPVRLRTTTIPYAEIKHFRITTKPFGQQPLLEAAAQAFNEPVTNSDGSIVCRWVKKLVTQREYEKHYSSVPAYRSLGSENGMVVVAFFLPVHLIDSQKLDYCTDEELQRLTR